MADDSDELRDDSGRFVPGHAGIPGSGRKPGQRTLHARIMEELGPQGLERYAKKLAESIDSEPAGPDFIKNTEWFLKREWPVPKTLEVGDPDGNPLDLSPKLDLSNLEPEERTQLTTLAAKALMGE